MTEPTADGVPVDEVLSPATPGAQALPSTEDDDATADDDTDDQAP